MKINRFKGSLRGKESEKWMEGLWDELINKLTVSGSPAEIKKILECLISDYEKRVILRRLGVIAFAQTGKSYRETSEALWLSPNTISTIRKNIIGDKAAYKSYRKFYGGPKLYGGEVRTSKSFWQELIGEVDLWDILMNPPRPRGIGITDSLGIPGRPWGHHKKKQK